MFAVGEGRRLWGFGLERFERRRGGDDRGDGGCRGAGHPPRRVASKLGRVRMLRVHAAAAGERRGGGVFSARSTDDRGESIC